MYKLIQRRSLTALVIITVLIAIVIYQRYLKPCPMQHFGLKNLSFEVLKNKSTIYPRLNIIREVEQAFTEGKGVLLVGEAGVGKSSIPIAMAELMEENKICTFMKGAPIFSCGASKLQSGGYNDLLNSITDRFYKYRDEVIFFFDEFHDLFKENTLSTRSRATDMKLFCQDFKYLIGATTTVEYEELVRDQPAIVGRRFKVIFIKPADDSEIKIALSQFLQTVYPEIVLENNALDYLIENAEKYEPNTSKIDAAHSFLNGVINKMTTFDFKELQDRLADLQNKKKEIEQHYQNVELDGINELNRQLQEKNAEIDQLEQELAEKNRRVKKMQKTEAYCLTLKRQSYQMADPNKKLEQGSLFEQKWLALQAEIKFLTDYIAQQRKDLLLPVTLDQELIQSTLKEQTTRRESEKTGHRNFTSKTA